jgi:hypothetical protein
MKGELIVQGEPVSQKNAVGAAPLLAVLAVAGVAALAFRGWRK